MDFEFTRPEVPSSSPLPSPTDTTRRFSQYKSRVSGTSLASSRPKELPKGHNINFQVSEPPQKLLWKERLRQQVALRQRKERQKRYERGRSEDPTSDASSEASGAVEEENEDDLDDELYRRIMIADRRRQAHYQKVTYEREVGDSDDIFMNDVEEFERQFRPNSSPQAIHGSNAASGLILPSEADPEQLYEAYLADIQAQADEDEEFEKEFEDIDPQTLADVLGRQ